MTKNKISRSSEIEEFAEKINPSLMASSTVSDNWLNQIKVYLKSDLSDGDVLFIFLNTYSMYLELLNARVADLISSEDRQILIAKCISYFAYFEGLIGKKGKEVEIARFTIDYIRVKLNASQATRAERDLSIVQFYTQYFMDSEGIGEKLSQEVINQYIVSQIQTFEEQDYRNKLIKILDGRRYSTSI